MAGESGVEGAFVSIRIEGAWLSDLHPKIRLEGKARNPAQALEVIGEGRKTPRSWGTYSKLLPITLTEATARTRSRARGMLKRSVQEALQASRQSNLGSPWNGLNLPGEVILDSRRSTKRFESK